MTFTETRLQGAFILDPERHEDSRGYFARTFCQRELAEHGLEPQIAQGSVSFNRTRGTVRGMHFSARETKLVRVTRGAVLDVIIDLRPESPTWLQHLAVALTAENGRSLYVPARFGHGRCWPTPKSSSSGGWPVRPAEIHTRSPSRRLPWELR
ncbi:MAG: dTDP-4-dehydrorhamnose 3,5-epimerase [Myxococcaceae bacterium]|nr:dTDP-4-dehydrorhamnose 3,5-epimerase [Myxococcaceae bacterium]